MTYENFIVPNVYWEYVLEQKRITFINEFYKKNNNYYPSKEEIANVVLTNDEISRYKRLFYAKYYLTGNQPQDKPITPDTPQEPNEDEEKVITISLNKENDNSRALLEKYEYEYLTFRVEYCKENVENPSETYLDTYGKYRPYAYGVFNKIDNISISLKLGYKYRFYVYYRPSNQSLPSSSYGYVNNKGWLYITNNFVLSNERVWHYGTGDIEYTKGFFAITDFNPKESNIISISLKKVYAMIALSIKNYINECIDINVGTINTSLQGGDNEIMDYEFNHINSLGFCSINKIDNTLTYEFPITYKTESAFRNGWVKTVENACDAVMRGDNYSEQMPLSVTYKKDFFDEGEAYKPLLTKTIDLTRGNTTYIEMDLESPENSFDFDIDIEDNTIPPSDGNEEIVNNH